MCQMQINSLYNLLRSDAINVFPEKKQKNKFMTTYIKSFRFLTSRWCIVQMLARDKYFTDFIQTLPSVCCHISWWWVAYLAGVLYTW